MVQVVLVGDDSVTLRSRRARLAETSGVHPAHVFRFDLADPDQLPRALDIVPLASMFGESRFIELSGAESLTEETAAALADGLRSGPSADTVVIWGSKLSAGAKKAFAHLSVETHNAPQVTSVTHIKRLAAEQGVHLDPDAVRHLDDLTGHDLGRVSSILYSLAVTGLTSPTPAHIDRFAAGVGTAPGTPWGIADALSTGDVATALTLADTCEPIAVISYLGNRLGQLGRIVETPLTTPAEVAGAFGIASLSGAARLLEHANRLGPAGIASSWTLLSSADVAVKRSAHPHVMLDSILVKLGRLWSHQTKQPASRTISPAGWFRSP